MIQNFNFYDVYGYFLPGFTLLALIWLPSGLIKGHWPEAALTSALVAVVVGYIIGHILQTLASKALPSKVTIRDERRSPSDYLLDAADQTFLPQIKRRLAESINDRFKIDVRIDFDRRNATDTELKDLLTHRQEAFFLCRSALIKSKIAFYAEQFEGLYAMMRGLVAAFFFGFLYHAGWALGSWSATSLNEWLWMLGGLGMAIFCSMLIIAPRAQKSAGTIIWATTASLMFAIFAFGYHSGRLSNAISQEQVRWLLAIALVDLFLSLKCYTSYKAFAQEFPKAIYRDFYAFEEGKIGATIEGRDKPNEGDGSART